MDDCRNKEGMPMYANRAEEPRADLRRNNTNWKDWAVSRSAGERHDWLEDKQNNTAMDKKIRT